MDSRFEYEILGRPEKAGAARSPRRRHSHPVFCVLDKKTGVRLNLTEEEQAAFDPLISRMTNGSTPFEVTIAFEEMAGALYQRRLGYCFEWDRLASRSLEEWNDWLSARLRPLRW